MLEQNQAQLWNPWNVAKVFLDTAGTIAAGYVGFTALSSMWDATPQLDLSVDVASGLAPALAHQNPISRHLLGSGENVTVTNPIPDLQFEASKEASYALDGNDIFAEDIFGVGVFVADDSSGRQILDLTTWTLTANVGNYEVVTIATDELGGRTEFRSSHRINPNGDLPQWLVYHPTSNTLEVIAPGPSERDEDEWVTQVKNVAGVTNAACHPGSTT